MRDQAQRRGRVVRHDPEPQVLRRAPVDFGSYLPCSFRPVVGRPFCKRCGFSLVVMPCRERLGLLNFDGDGLFLWLGEASVMACREVRIDGDVP